MAAHEIPSWHGTTILTVRKGGTVVIGGDGQVSIGQTIIKSNAKKVRKLGKGDVIGGNSLRVMVMSFLPFLCGLWLAQVAHCRTLR